MSSTRILMVRARPHNRDREKEFLEGTISLGWPVGESFAGKGREEVGSLLSARGWRTELAISMIQNFVNLPPSSIILTPGIRTKQTLHVFIDSKPYAYRPEAEEDGNPHVIEAIYTRSVPINRFPEVVQRAVKAGRRSVTQLDKYAAEIMPVLGAPADSPDAPHPPSGELQNEVRETLRNLLKSADERVRLQAALALKDML